ncbi:hypothetical protein Pcinc_013374 [Petrolisthes cinctipes]|uniref:Uncharacterized protein n=1 Tax=Petrolisthes cinctipes TaxID=88211 RepID=A0AAE1KRN3_PETCI|nr:hypothetical protein Pcinc_013374 [Petrolisthes cinctipes]
MPLFSHSSSNPTTSASECLLTPDLNYPLPHQLQATITSAAVAASHLRALRQITTEKAFPMGVFSTIVETAGGDTSSMGGLGGGRGAQLSWSP